ncbi:MAG: proline racemase family protein [bacterium]|nr:proline racemase family protein [bacterium]MDE0239227.1 proline racemase family protein [bacterium]
MAQPHFRTPGVLTRDDLCSRNTAVVVPGRIDRCPRGTRTEARLIVLHVHAQTAVGQSFPHRSPIDSALSSEFTEPTGAGPDGAVVSAMSGRSWFAAARDDARESGNPSPRGDRTGDTKPGEP